MFYELFFIFKHFPVFYNVNTIFTCIQIYTGNPDLENHFDQLIKLQNSLGTISTNVDQERVELGKLQEENKRWENEVQSFKERESLKTSVKLLEKKKVWLQYKEELNIYKRCQSHATNLKQQYDKIAARFKPLEEKIAAKEKLILKTQEQLKRMVPILI